MRYQIL